MSKKQFLFVDLNDNKLKSLGETITSETSRKILNYLVGKEDTEAKIAESLGLPISTAHYHLQKLQQAGLVRVDEFHYSQKGREVNHYKLVHEYIIIGPQRAGLSERLRAVLPMALISLGIAAVIQWITLPTQQAVTTAESAPMMKADVMMMAEPVVQGQSDLALWFLLGSAVAMLGYVVYGIVSDYSQKKKSSG